MNIVGIAGNLTKDPELRSTQTGKKVVNFSIAINEGKDKTEFVNCIAWEKTAELIKEYCSKGDRLSCSGKLQTRTWEDQSGTKRYATEVVVMQFDFPPKSSKASNTDTHNGYSSNPQNVAQAHDYEEDDLPF